MATKSFNTMEELQAFTANLKKSFTVEGDDDSGYKLKYDS